MKEVAEKFMEVFTGMEEAHGTYIITDEIREDGKREGKAFTTREPVLLRHWIEHLAGKQTLGIIPIRKDNSCMWGAIDIDVYDLDIETLAKKVSSRDLPLVPFRSKSGGCHLVMFMKEPVSASRMQKKLREIAASLGYGQSEIFPKQSEVLLERGDMGNWLNMPYFGGERTSRYALDAKGESLSLTEFVEVVESERITEAEFKKIEVRDTVAGFEHAPPCLQALIAQGFPSGTRNNGLFDLGVYARKAYPDDWKTRLEEFNAQYMDPPLESKEVQNTVKQLEKKDYGYKCSDLPLKGFCNAGVCRTLRFGIGRNSLPDIGGLARIPSDQPVWFLTIETARVELTTEQLQNQRLFQRVCMDAIKRTPHPIPERQWVDLIQGLMDKCEDIEIPPEASMAGHFFNLLESFCTDGNMSAVSKEDLFRGKPWTDEEKGLTYFRMQDLEEYLTRHNFRNYTRTQISARIMEINKKSDRIREAGDQKAHTFFKIKGRGVNVWSVPMYEYQNESFDLPDFGGDKL